ncbi:MAG: PTS transporter subunit EIIC [Sebaldella sp.]|nr:PTS transporter subunit EIIC [Sebaldella sp.]
MLKKLQRFGGAMFTPVMLFAFAGVVVGLTILFKNPDIFGSMATPDHLWYKIFQVIEEGGWTVFRQMPLLFAVGLPIGLAKKAHARACLETLVSYLTFNYFLSAILTLWGGRFGVDMTQEVGGMSGLTDIAGIKTLDTSIIGAIAISAIIIAIHNRYFDTKLPDFLGIFQGSSFVVIIAFFAMIPCALLTALIWPPIQEGIASMQGFLISSQLFGVWLYTFLERILIPTGLHHFIYGPFIFGPAVVEGGIAKYWAEHLPQFAASTEPIKQLFPQGGFALHGNSKIFGIPGISAAIYVTAKPEKKKMVLGLLVSATLTAIMAGITEPLEFTFLFIAPALFAVHAVLAATMATVMYAFGVVGNMGGGLIEIMTQNWIPLFKNHSSTVLIQIFIGLMFTVIYFFVFRFLILKFNIMTPGREEDDGADVKLYSKADYKAKKGDLNNKDAFMDQALIFLDALGGKENIQEVNNCATRLRVSIIDEAKIKPDGAFREGGAHGVVRNGKAIQIVVGLSVPQVRDRFEDLMKE